MPVNPYGRFDAPIVTVDVVIFTLHEGNLQVLVAERPREPAKGQIGLIGGWVHTDEDKNLEQTVERVLRVKAGLTDVFVEQLQTVSDADRHPEAWSLSVVYMAVIPMADLAPAFAMGCELRPADNPGALALDHNTILDIAKQRLRAKGAYSTIPMEFLPDRFSIPQLLSAYEAVMGDKLDEGSFRRKIMALELIRPVKGPKTVVEGSNRPVVLYEAATKGTFDRSFRR